MPLSISEDSQQHTQGNESVTNKQINTSGGGPEMAQMFDDTLKGDILSNGLSKMESRRQSHPIQVETEIRYKVKE
jgi:hypothetical protein